MRKQVLAAVLAKSFLAGALAAKEAAARGRRTLGRRWQWLRPLARQFVETFTGRTWPRLRDAAWFLLHNPGFEAAWSKYSHELRVARWLTEPALMQPVAATAAWELPVIESVADLAAWFRLHPDELQWFADLKGLCYRNPSPVLGHYHYRVLQKQYGSIRLIEAPKPRLKQMQQQILSQILDRVPTHPAVHGFAKERSIKTFAAPHVGKPVVLRMDLRDFFPSFPAARIQSLFRTLGYPEAVADLLGALCSNATPRRVWTQAAAEAASPGLRDMQAFYTRRHLPQGAPTSPALANLCTYRADCRLHGLARSIGIEYTRYADDLAFSGGAEFGRQAARFAIHVAAILLEEGLSVNHRKTRIMRQGVRQYLAGLVVNQRLNVARTDFDRLKAILTNCVRHGPDTQNLEAHPDFRSHLEGRVTFIEMINPAKGRRLRALFDQIRWA